MRILLSYDDKNERRQIESSKTVCQLLYLLGPSAPNCNHRFRLSLRFIVDFKQCTMDCSLLWTQVRIRDCGGQIKHHLGYLS